MKTLFLALLTLNSFALVDYSDPAENMSQTPAVQTAPRVQKVGPTSAKKSQSSQGSFFSNYLEFSSSFASHKYNVNSEVGSYSKKYESLDLKGQISTDYDVFLAFEQSFYSGKSSNDGQNVSNERGNPLIILGFNWLEFGSPSEALTIDLTLGARLSTKGEFATTRTDKLIGFETSKRFYNVAFGFGYDYILTGPAKEISEMDIGNISNLYAKLGVVVSGDIKFLLTAVNSEVKASDDTNRESYLKKSIKYSYVKPEIVLTMGRSVDLSLGAVFQTRRPKQENIKDNLNLWSQTGLYGNSLMAGLGFSL